MPQPYTPPEYESKAFNCPLCHAYAQQYWQKVYREAGGSVRELPEYRTSKCSHCNKWMMWYDGTIIVPDVSAAPPANDDLNEDIKSDYAEAASIVGKSPRGAAALLRLCIQKLCKQLGQSGKNIDKDIGILVANGLDVRVQKALDTVRVIGNECVHPGEMDLRDDPDTAGMLFTLVNAIANDMITQPRLREELYGKLPKAKLDGIAARDAKSKVTPEDSGSKPGL
ncbi:MAG TPA: DUF4145 domain-containing protein [Methyloceanibacter sp.]|nr:DUF4145 domain-containing protein [Methyloceanibacter sp.]